MLLSVLEQTVNKKKSHSIRKQGDRAQLTMG